MRGASGDHHPYRISFDEIALGEAEKLSLASTVSEEGSHLHGSHRFQCDVATNDQRLSPLAVKRCSIELSLQYMQEVPGYRSMESMERFSQLNIHFFSFEILRRSSVTLKVRRK